MDEVYERTENGATVNVSRAEGLAEINEAMTSGRRRVQTMSSITRTNYDIHYKDGRHVRLEFVVPAPAPEGARKAER